MSIEGKRGPLVIGILNVTPDSFSDGGQWIDPTRALEHGLEMVRQGADVVDVGGESTRPGAQRAESEQERQRVIPVVTELVAHGVTVSVDTMRSDIARECLELGAAMINDVSGGLADPAMAATVADSDATYVAMHWRAHSDQAGEYAYYDDVVAEVTTELRHRLDALTAAGVDEERIVIDPGFGFSKEAAHNWQLLARLDRVAVLGHRMLVGTSRKRFLGLAHDGRQRDVATAATSLLAAQADAWAVRVHDVPATVAALDVWQQVRDAR